MEMGELQYMNEKVWIRFVKAVYFSESKPFRSKANISVYYVIIQTQLKLNTCFQPSTFQQHYSTIIPMAWICTWSAPPHTQGDWSKRAEVNSFSTSAGSTQANYILQLVFRVPLFQSPLLSTVCLAHNRWAGVHHIGWWRGSPESHVWRRVKRWSWRWSWSKWPIWWRGRESRHGLGQWWSSVLTFFFKGTYCDLSCESNAHAAHTMKFIRANT